MGPWTYRGVIAGVVAVAAAVSWAGLDVVTAGGPADEQIEEIADVKTLVEIPDQIGDYLIRVTESTVTVEPVRILRTGPVPPDPQPPAPDGLSVRGRAIKEAAAKASADKDLVTNAWKLATAYRETARRIGDKEIVGQESIALWVKTATDMLLGGRAAEAWKPMRETFSQQWAEVLNVGGKDADFAKLLIDAAAGLESVGPRPEALVCDRGELFAAAQTALDEYQANPQALDWATILKIVMMVLEMLSKLFP